MLAQHSHKGFEEYLRKFVQSSDPDFARQGDWMVQLVARHEELSQSLQVLQRASPFTRLYAFITHYQSDIAKAAFTSFRPALPVTLEACMYALVGIGIALIVFKSVAFLFSPKKLNPQAPSSDN